MDRPPSTGKLGRWATILGVALAARVAASLVVQRYADMKGRLCVFADTDIYWLLAGQIKAGSTYVAMQWDRPHYALRTPGYPLFLAACRWAFGDATLPARLAQAALGAGSVWVLAKLVEAVGLRGAGRWSPAMAAAAWAAVDPLAAGTSALLLSEAVFLPLMLASLWSLAAAWGSGSRRAAVAAGALMGLGVLVKPSWALFAPAACAAWVATAGRGRRGLALRGTLLVGLAMAATMAPWWVRNARVCGRFVPTALWLGASLHDGLRPGADGSSDMRFLADADVRGLDEAAQDAELRRRALAFARSNPGQALRLAALKAGRYWSPWPNADALRSRAAAWGASAVTLPFYLGLIVGAWTCRRQPMTLTLLLGPLLYFAALHMAFASSIRYRITPGVPALGLAAVGWLRLASRPIPG